MKSDNIQTGNVIDREMIIYYKYSARKIMNKRSVILTSIRCKRKIFKFDFTTTDCEMKGN